MIVLGVYAVFVSAWAVFQQSLLAQRDSEVQALESENSDLKESLQKWVFKAREQRLKYENCQHDERALRESFLEMQTSAYKHAAIMDCTVKPEFKSLEKNKFSTFENAPALRLLLAVQNLDVVRTYFGRMSLVFAWNGSEGKLASSHLIFACPIFVGCLCAIIDHCHFTNRAKRARHAWQRLAAAGRRLVWCRL